MLEEFNIILVNIFSSVKYSVVIYLFFMSILSFFLYFVLKNKINKINPRGFDKIDIRREVFLSTIAIFFIGVLNFLFAYFAENIGIDVFFEKESSPMLVFYIPVFYVLHDTLFYWTHRFLHLSFFFNLTHKYHHLSKSPSLWAAFSFGMFETFCQWLISLLAVLVLPFTILESQVLLFSVIVINAIGHSGIEFLPKWWIRGKLKFIITVTHHDLHHSKGGGNYAVYFTWWDKLMGTEIKGYEKEFLRNTLKKKRIKS